MHGFLLWRESAVGKAHGGQGEGLTLLKNIRGGIEFREWRHVKETRVTYFKAATADEVTHAW